MEIGEIPNFVIRDLAYNAGNIKENEMEFPATRSYVMGLLISCPYKPDPTDCALHDIRKRPIEERIEFSKQLTDKEILRIIAIHKKCLAQKEVKKHP